MSEEISPEPKVSPKSGRLATFFRRFGTTIFLWIPIGAGLFFGHPLLCYLLICGFAVLGLIEYFTLLNFRHARWEAIATLTIAAAYVTACFWQAAGGGGIDFGYLDTLAIVAITFVGFFINLVFPVKIGRSHVAVMACVFGFIYIAFLFNFLTRILFLPEGASETIPIGGRGYLLYLLAVTKFTDVGAYVVGSLIGKHKMAPRISPGKTWEGFFGAIGVAFLFAFGIRWMVGDEMPLLTPLHTCMTALIIALFAILGDLVESTLKRSLARKDSGDGLPGIGGVLDLIDSVLFTAPVFFFYLLWLNA